MRFKPSIMAAMLAGIALASALPQRYPAFAQVAGEPDSGDDPDDPDDPELDDPDNLDDGGDSVDSGGDGGDDGSDNGSVDDAGSDDAGGDDAGGDDAGGDDAGSDDAGGDDAGGDDAGGDDAGGDDVGGDDAGGDDDRDDGDGNNDDEDDRDDDTESEAERADFDARDSIDTDQEGFRYRRGEFVALDLTEKDISDLHSQGFEIISSEPLQSVDGTLHLLRGPPRLADSDALDLLESSGDPGRGGFNHLFDSSAVQTSHARGKALPIRTACGCDIGLIDTGVANNLSLFRHVSLAQKAFNGGVPAPRLHGTAVSHLMAGTRKNAANPTRIYVADIFSGPRATAGSTHALIRALDWLAAQGVAVINVSLAGPRNPAVAATIARLTQRGHLVVAAAGNDGPAAPPVFPGAYAGVVAVTAVDRTDRVYRYANRGQQVDFAARGVSILSIDSQGRTTDATGTSFAAPIIAARLAQYLREPDATAATRAIRRLEKSARDLGPPGRDPIYGVGLIEDPEG